MILYKITLKPLSSFVIGSHQHKDNHFTTLDYIPAPNLQGAFARRILESHSRYDVQQCRSTGKPQYWIDDSIPVDGCEPQWISWLKSFGQMRFTDATPFGVGHFSPSTFGCKSHEDHPLVEILPRLYRGRDKPLMMDHMFCSVCGDRLERKSGWQWPKGKYFYRRTITRVALDGHRRVSSDGMLFSLEAGEPYADRQGTPLIYEAYVSVPLEVIQHSSLEIRDEILHIGKYITVGFGRMSVNVEEVESPAFPEDELQSWQDEFGELSAAIQLNGKLPLPLFEEERGTYHDIDYYHQKYTEWFREVAYAPEGVRVTFAYTQQLVQRSFQPGRMQRKEKLERFVLPGAVFVFESESSELLRNWLQRLHTDGIWHAPYWGTVRIMKNLSSRGGEILE